MAENARQPSRPIDWHRILDIIKNISSFLIVFGIAIFGFLGAHFFLPGGESEMEESGAVETESRGGSIVLTGEKKAAAGIRLTTVRKSEFQPVRQVPAKVIYDPTSKVEIRATVDCMIAEPLVRPNQQVKTGQPLLKITSPEVGRVRNQIEKSDAKARLLRDQYEWNLATHSNVIKLLDILTRTPSIEEIEKTFREQALGQHRDEIFRAYSEFVLARNQTTRAKRLLDQGVLAGKEYENRKSALEIARAKLESIQEEMRFTANKELVQSKNALEEEIRNRDNLQQQLDSQIGATSRLTDGKNSRATFVLHAPSDGTVVELSAVKNSRFEPGEVMITLADTRTVWIEAQISQTEVNHVSLDSGTQLRVHLTGFEDLDICASFKHMGSAVNLDTRSVPVVAQLDNADRRFRPGMSGWIDVPTEKARKVIVVPEAAIQRINMRAVVFVPLNDDSFEVREVNLGNRSRSEYEVRSGLKEGDVVVTQGSFFLKSELILSLED